MKEITKLVVEQHEQETGNRVPSNELFARHLIPLGSVTQNGSAHFQFDIPDTGIYLPKGFWRFTKVPDSSKH